MADDTTPDGVVIRRLSDALYHRSEQWGDRVAHINDRGETLTHVDWNAEADAIAGGLAAAGVAPGDRLLLPITNHGVLHMARAYVAAHRAGAICVPINTRWTSSEANWFAGHVGAAWAITDKPGLVTAPGVKVWGIDEMPRDLASLPRQDELPGPDDEADFDIIPTSGTTARPKGVVSSERDAVASLALLTRKISSAKLLHSLPMTSAGGIQGFLITPVRDGTTVITVSAFEAEPFIALAQQQQVNSLFMVPATLRLMLESPAMDGADLSSVRFIFVGSAALPSSTVDLTRALLPGAKLVNSYGATEFGSGNQLRLDPKLIATKANAVGRPVGGGAVEVRDEQGMALPPGETGEIWMKSRGAARRYWNDPEATARTWRDGWVNSGDLGYIDPDGDVILVGRTKEMVIRGGINIAPAEIEDAILQFPGIREAAVVGVPHEVLGEDVVGVLVTADVVSFDQTALEQFLATRLARFKIPRRFVLVEELPRNAMGKVVRRELLEKIVPEPTSKA